MYEKMITMPANFTALTEEEKRNTEGGEVDIFGFKFNNNLEAVLGIGATAAVVVVAFTALKGVWDNFIQPMFDNGDFKLF